MMTERYSIQESIQQPPCRKWPAQIMLILSMLGLMLTGCASWQPPPAEFDDSVLRARAETGQVKGVKLSAAVLSTVDSQRMFGANINGTGVQPVWIEVENTTDQMLWLLRPGTDPDLFSPLEVAWSFHRSFAGETNALLDDHFHRLSFQNPIAPGTKQSGVIFTNPHQQSRLLNIDILGQGQLFPFTLFLAVPDDRTDDDTVLENVYQLIEMAVDDYQNADTFRARLEQLPCCASSADGNAAGDPLNVILVGDFADIVTALVRRGFRSSALEFDSVQRLFDRPPDIVGRKIVMGGMPANWVRLWVAPFRYQGKTVFVVQAGRRQGWRLTEVEDKDLMLNPNVDEVRNLLIQDLLYSNGLSKIAFVSGVGPTGPGEVRDSLGGASYHTDGLRVVLFLVTRPLSLSDVQILDWHPALKLREADAVKEIENDSQ
jgi:hypothetical protein